MFNWTASKFRIPISPPITVTWKNPPPEISIDERTFLHRLVDLDQISINRDGSIAGSIGWQGISKAPTHLTPQEILAVRIAVAEQQHIEYDLKYERPRP